MEVVNWDVEWIELGQNGVEKILRIHIGTPASLGVSLAAIKTSCFSRTSKWVWGKNERVILLCVLRGSRSSHIWRLCRVSAGLTLDYG
ncbi:hypothetical protein H5410_038205 [Solanum commersonii]|uniref:Uncharacterized protein n=1 Tax=Solanum commersonii TaxID=4109 RepID=A0A9J5YA35_SOLCO|nr:hypothetical protein H5410_038205 [Solanum commersonii]